jgi:hypothetical protein
MALPNKTSYLMGGTYNSNVIVLTDGDLSPLQFDINGNLKVNLVSGGGSGSNAAASPTGAPVPADADYLGVNVSGNLDGVTGFAVGSSVGIAVAIIDGSGNQITSFGGGTQYADGTTQATPTGTVAIGKNPSNVLHALSLDGSGNLNVNIAAGSSSGIQFADNAASGVTPTGTLSMGWDSVNSKIRALKVDASQNLLVAWASAQHVIIDSASLGTVTISGSVSVSNFPATQPVSGTVTANQGTANTAANSWSVEVTDGTNILGTASHPVRIDPTGTTTQPVSGSVSISGNVNVTQGTSPWVISFNAPQHVIVDSGTISVTQGTSPWVVSLASTTITGNVNVVGTTTDGTTTETNFLVVGGESNDGTAQYQPIPLGTTGRSVIIEGVAGGTAIPISGSISFSAPQHVIVDSGSVSVTQGTSPWVVSLTSTTITGNVNVVGTTTDGTTGETNFLVVGGESNDATAQYQPIPLGAGGRSVIVEGVAAGTAIPVSGTVTANQGTANTLANAWPHEITDGTNGPVAVKAASTRAVATDPSFVVALSPNSPLGMQLSGGGVGPITGTALTNLNALAVMIVDANGNQIGISSSPLPVLLPTNAAQETGGNLATIASNTSLLSLGSYLSQILAALDAVNFNLGKLIGDYTDRFDLQTAVSP